MKKNAIGKGSLAVLAAAGALALQGCEVALIGATAGGAMTAFEDRRTSGVQIDDEAIELRITNRVAERFGEKVHLNVNTYNRWALLTGEAPDDQTRAEVEKMALAVVN